MVSRSRPIRVGHVSEGLEAPHHFYLSEPCREYRSRSPIRPEEFHHRRLTEPCVRVSPYTARRGFEDASLRKHPLSGGKTVRPGCPVDHKSPIQPRHPLGSTPITGASWLLSDNPPSQDAFLFCISLLAYSFSVRIILRLPKFLTRARNRFLPPIRRIPPGQ